MTERLAGMDADRLGAALSALRRDVAFPEADLVTSVRARLEEVRPLYDRVAPLRLPPRPRVRRLAFAFAATLVVAAVAGGLVVRGVRIRPGPERPTASPGVGGMLFLGQRATLDDARDLVRFPVLVPLAAGLPRSEVWYSPFPPGGRVSLVYPAGPGLPRASETGAGLLVTEFVGDLEEPQLEKLVHEGVRVTEVTVNGRPGYWLEGSPHTVFYVDSDGEPFADSVRLAGNTLLWEQGGVTVRIESGLGLDRVLAIAASLR